MIRVIIADDHPIVREGLKKVLEKTPDIVVAEEVSTGEELLGKIRETDYDAVVLDIAMPGRGGLETLEQLKAEKPRLPILMISIHPEEHYGVRVLKAGASGFMNKEKAPAELIGAIRKVAMGGKYVSSSLAERLAFDLDPGKGKQPHERLSNREYQVMCLIASGKRVSEIAKELSLSVNTISTHRSRILEKMKMKSNAEITNYVIKKGLLD